MQEIDKQMTVHEILFYHLLPGIPVLLLAVILSNPSLGFGFPIFFSLLIIFAFYLIPVQWVILFIIAHKEKRKLVEIIGFHSKMPITNTILYALPGIIFAAFIFTFGTKIEQPIWISEIFSWVPEWFIVDRYASNTGNLLPLTIILNFIFRGFLLPFTEEIYFRGFLLPRMNRFGNFAPLISTTLFSIYHLFAPWENISRMIAVLPFIYIVYRKKNICIGIISHCMVNFLSCFAMFLTLLQLKQ